MKDHKSKKAAKMKGDFAMAYKITIHYHGASSMTVILDRFFPCKAKDLRILLFMVKLDHAERANHVRIISAFLQNRVSRCKEMLKYEPDLGTANKIAKLQHKYAKNLEKVIAVSSKWKGITE